MLQSYIDAWVEELELVVNAYEAAVDEVEQAMDRVEQTNVSTDPGEQFRHNQYLRELDIALESAQQVAALVKAVDAALNDAIEAAQLVTANEQLGMPVEQCEEYAAVDQFDVPVGGLPASREVERDESAGSETVGDGPSGRAARDDPANREARRDGPSGRAARDGAGSRATTRVAPTIHGVLDAVGVLNQDSSLEALPGGTIIIQGNYRVVRLLYCRPRLNLYLAERINDHSRNGGGLQLRPLVAIRELVLAGLTSELSRQIDRAAFDEFAAPMLFGSPHLPGVGDRVCVENERHYTVMQLRQVRGKQHAMAVSLAELLLHQPRWPAWLDIDTAWEWGMQLCRTVARLHRMGVNLGGLHPATILVDPQSAVEWAPVLLVSWPPPSRFWSISTCSSQSAQELSTQVFPIAIISSDNAFAAPETFNGAYDGRSDVYSLGAILYLLLTRYPPVTASPGACAGQHAVSGGKQEEGGMSAGGGRCASEHRELIPPHLFNRRIPLELEQVVVRALSRNAVERYSSVDALLEALGSVYRGRNPVPPHIGG